MARYGEAGRCIAMVKKKTNPILPIGAVLIVGIVLGAFFLLRSEEPDLGEASAVGGDGLVPESVDEDSVNETILALRGESQAIMQDNEAYKQQIDQLQQALRDMEAVRAEELEALKSSFETGQLSTENNAREMAESMSTQLDSITEAVQTRLAGLEESLMRRNSEEALALRVAEVEEEARTYQSGERIEATEGLDIVFVRSLDRRAAQGGGPIDAPEEGGIAGVASGLTTGGLLNPEGATASSRGAQTVASLGNSHDPNVRSSVLDTNVVAPAIAAPEPAEPTTEKVFTVPDLSVLGRATTVTALLGKVYPDEDIVNPFPVKILIGRENLTANFQDLPDEIEGMLFGGYAIGDKAFSCAEVNLTSATFVFYDGTVRSAYIGDEGTRPANSAYRKDSIGYVADSWGHPCIPGEYVTDAAKQLGALAGLYGLEGYARALRQQEITTSVFDGNGGPLVVDQLTGSATRYAAASGIADGLEGAVDWLKEGYAKITEAYYVPAGMNVSVHLTQEIRLDIEPDAREIRYSRGGTSHARLD